MCENPPNSLAMRGDLSAHRLHRYDDPRRRIRITLTYTWSLATIAGLSLQEFSGIHGVALDASAQADIDDRVRRAAYRIIEGKGATYYGIGSALARIVDVILHDQRSILTICSRIENMLGIPDITISMPHLLGGEGVITSIPLSLDEPESLALKASAAIIQDAIQSLDLATN